MTGPNNQLAGYANPPAQHRFQKGTSGNPRGRPRKKVDLWDHLTRVLNRKIKLQGRDDRIPIREALIRRLRELSLAGDRRALEMQRRILAEADAADVERYDPDREVQEILGRIAAAMKTDGGGDA